MLGNMKLTIGRCAEKFGYTIVPNWALDNYPAARYMRRLFKLLSVDLVLDVGANQGQYSCESRSDIRIISSPSSRSRIWRRP